MNQSPLTAIYVQSLDAPATPRCGELRCGKSERRRRGLRALLRRR